MVFCSVGYEPLTKQIEMTEREFKHEDFILTPEPKSLKYHNHQALTDELKSLANKCQRVAKLRRYCIVI